MGRHLDKALFREARNAGGSAERVRELLAAGAKVNRRHHCGSTPLCAAASHGRSDLVTLLLAAGADPNIYQVDGSGPLHWAANNGHFSVVEQLLNAGADPNALRDSGQSVLAAAISNGHAEIVRRLIAAGAAVEHRYHGITMPQHAERCGQGDIAAMLRRSHRRSRA